MSAISLLTTLVMALAGAPGDPSPEAVKAVEAAHKAMKTQLLKTTPKAEIELRQELGPFGTVVAVAAIFDAYPGSGVMRTVIDAKSGTTYGARGKKTFADFARAHGWLTRLPSNDELVMFVNLALFDGIAILDRQSGETIESTADGFFIQVVRRYMPSNSGERLTITVGKSGAETIKKEPISD